MWVLLRPPNAGGRMRRTAWGAVAAPCRVPHSPPSIGGPGGPPLSLFGKPRAMAARVVAFRPARAAIIARAAQVGALKIGTAEVGSVQADAPELCAGQV